MKPLCSLTITLIFIATLLLSCSDHRYPKCLMQADSLCDVSPDSALSMLHNIKGDMAKETEPVRMFYDLLCVKASDKCFILQTSDTTVLRLVNYYEKHKDRDLLPVAYHYAGSAYRDLNDVPQAIEYFQKAADCVEHSIYKNRMEHLIYSRLGDLFIYQHLYDQSEKMYKKAYMCNKVSGNIEGLMLNLRDIGYVNLAMEHNDMAYNYYNQSLQLAKKTHNKMVEANISGQIAYYYCIKGDFRTAYKYIQRSLEYNNKYNQSSDLSILSKVYHGLGLQDSMIACCKKMLTVGDVYARRSALSCLSDYYVTKGNTNIAYDYIKQYVAVTDTINSRNAIEITAQMNAAYNYKHKAEETFRTMMEAEKSKKIYIVTTSLFIVLVCILVVIVVNIKKRNLERHMQMQNKFNFIESERDAFSQELKLMKNKERLQQNAIILSEARLSGFPIMQRLKSVGSQIKPLNVSEWRELDYTVNNIYKGFKEKLEMTCRISNHEYHICLLLKLGIQPTDIAMLVCKSKSAVTASRKRLAERAFGPSSSSKDLDKFILSL